MDGKTFNAFIPQFYEYKEVNTEYHYMAIEILGPSLSKVIKKYGNRLSLINAVKVILNFQSNNSILSSFLTK